MTEMAYSKAAELLLMYKLAIYMSHLNKMTTHQ